MNPEQAFKELLEIGKTLLGPNGCVWDHEQTFSSLRSSVLEEACEVIEAIDNEDDENLAEELGDLLYQVVFLALIAEKENRFLLTKSIRLISEKLIRRHPHVFGDVKIDSSDEVLKQWDKIKQIEKSDRTSLLDGIPKGLPALARAFTIAKKLKKSSYPKEPIDGETLSLFETEEELGELLWTIVKNAKLKKLNPEHALKKVLTSKEASFRDWENNSKIFTTEITEGTAKDT